MQPVAVVRILATAAKTITPSIQHKQALHSLLQLGLLTIEKFKPN